MDKFWERYIQSRPAPGESKGAFEAFAAANRDPEPRNMAHGGRIGFLKGKRVKDKIFKYPYSNQHGTFYSDKPVDMDRTQNREYKIDKPTKKQLEIAEKVHGKKYNKTGIDLWESLEQFERSNIRERRTTGQTSGIGKPKKNMLSKTDFIELVKNNRNKTYNEFVEIIKKYKTKDGKTELALVEESDVIGQPCLARLNKEFYTKDGEERSVWKVFSVSQWKDGQKLSADEVADDVPF